MKIQLNRGDVLEWCRRYDGPPHHAALLDPPYHLSGGFMGKSWDKDGPDAVAFQPETWAALGEHLHPGAFGFAFASSRGVHRMACAIEDAGFRLHPTIFCWVTGQSFPKATRVPDERFEGHRYGGQALKGSVEPIVCFQKPYSGRPVDCITATGAGALWIDGGRIEGEKPLRESTNGVEGMFGMGSRMAVGTTSEGRWPANFCLDRESAALLDAQSGYLHDRGNKAQGDKHIIHGLFNNGLPRDNVPHLTRGDSGGASRFFHVSDWNSEVSERLDEAEPVRYSPKTSTAERNAGCADLPAQEWADDAPVPQRGERPNVPSGNHHPTLKPLSLTRWLASLLLPPVEYAPRRLLVPFSGTCSEAMGGALAGWEHITAIEQSGEYVDIARARIRYHLGMLAEVDEQVLAEAQNG